MALLFAAAHGGAEGEAASSRDDAFADAVADMRALCRDAMVAALRDDSDGMLRASRQAEQLRDFHLRRGAPEAVCDVRDELALLNVWPLQERTDQLGLLERLLASPDADSEVRARARHWLVHEPRERLARLRREDRYNRLTSVVNYGVDLATGILFGNFQRLANPFIDLVFVREPATRLSPRNRLALDVAARMTPTDAELPPALQRYIQRLGGRVAAERLREAAARAHWHAANGRWEQARTAWAAAMQVSAQDDEALRRGRLEAAQRASAEERQRLAELASPEPPDTVSPPQQAAARRLALAIAAGDDEALALAAGEITERPAAVTPSLRASALYAGALAGKEPARRDANTTGAARDLNSGYLAHTGAARLADRWAERPSPEGPFPGAVEEALGAADRRRRVEALQYLLFADNRTEGSPAALSGRDKAHRVVDSLGILLPFQWIARGLQLARSEPVSEAPWRDEAARLLRLRGVDPAANGGGPEPSPAAAPLAGRLADSCERAGRFDAARAWWAIAETGEEARRAAVQRLDTKEARALLREARSKPLPIERRAGLRDVAERFPETRSGRKAASHLARLNVKPEKILQITRRDLAESPRLWRGRGMRLDPAWLDGGPANGEMTRAGVWLLGPDASRLQLETESPQGRRERFVDLDHRAREELEQELSVWLGERAGAERVRRALSLWRYPVEVSGAAGPGGIEAAPRLLPVPFDAESLPLYAPAFPGAR